ncbi:MAG: hypothetical protein R2843_09185 [Thermomicrobiales bacterium]
MVLGRSRVKTPPAFPRALTSQPAEWHLGRPSIYETNVDLSGAFPGYVERGGRLDHGRLSVYEHGLAIDEGRTNGFYLPFERIVATDEDEFESDGEPLVRIRYQDAHQTRLFSIRPRSPRLVMRSGSGRRTTRLMSVLHEQGAPGGPVDDVPLDAFMTHWGETDAFGHETMVWHGLPAPRFCSPANATMRRLRHTEVICWGRDARSPISRVPLSAIRDVTPGHDGSRNHHLVPPSYGYR